MKKQTVPPDSTKTSEALMMRAGFPKPTKRKAKRGKKGNGKSKGN